MLLFIIEHVPLISVKEHIKYLRDKRGVKENTIREYVYSASKLGILELDTDRLPALWNKLAEMLPTRDPQTNQLSNKKYGYIYKMRILIESMLRLHNVAKDSYEYNVFIEQLDKLKHVPVAYTEEQVRLLIKEAKFAGRNFGLYRLLVFMTYTGCRVTSCANVMFSKMKTVDEVPNVYAVPVIGKGHAYDAIIAKHVVNELQSWNPARTDYISNWSGEVHKSCFADYNRSLLGHVIVSKGIQDKITVDTTIFHSIRKFFANKLAEDEVESDNISLLLGQIPNSLAWKAYITSQGKNMAKVTIRAAKAYARTSFMTTKYWEEKI